MKKTFFALMTCLIFVFTMSTAFSADPQQGETLYKKCVSCHGADASKHGLNKLSEENFIKNLKMIRDDTSSNYGAMKKIFKTYSEEDIKNLASYVQSL